MPKFTIELDSKDFEPGQWESHAVALIRAKDMQIAINSYYDDVLRNLHEYVELTPDQQRILNTITDNLREHFKQFFYEE
jgi:hypothetical protein